MASLGNDLIAVLTASKDAAEKLGNDKRFAPEYIAQQQAKVRAAAVADVRARAKYAQDTAKQRIDTAEKTLKFQTDVQKVSTNWIRLQVETAQKIAVVQAARDWQTIESDIEASRGDLHSMLAWQGALGELSKRSATAGDKLNAAPGYIVTIERAINAGVLDAEPAELKTARAELTAAQAHQTDVDRELGSFNALFDERGNYSLSGGILTGGELFGVKLQTVEVEPGRFVTTSASGIF